MVLTWTIHDLLKHLMIDLPLIVISDGIRGNMLASQWWLSMLPERAVSPATNIDRTGIAHLVCGIASFTFLLSCIDNQASIPITSKPIIDRVGAMLGSVDARASHWSALSP